ncbi:hypothetical protein ACGFJC_06935 [Nonomuraea fuscirosea]|uniref:Uncharacterized protein n=1 Tax=Nonomuraea fuscirosea TaxID=1291556 RepID=A0A2T0MQL3_9ACTN|nr:hypothetical protein [Nonomuraea fuscirosea]PRX60450.1 hypothetical protein B0I32_117217 [Nonomuraea fuscirosea]
MIGGRVIMEAPLVDAELLTLKKRVDSLEEQVRTLTAANLALVRSMENLQRISPAAAG